MRVVGGFYRSRILEWPDDVKHIRPTKDRIREAIFNALGDISGATFLDLYSGSGAFGIEAISRGASKSIFVDVNPVAINTTRKNITNLKIDSKIAPIYSMNDVDALDLIADKKEKVNIIFLDPPYKEGKYDEILNIVFDKQILSDDGIIVLESDHYIDVDKSSYSRRRDYKYGEIYVAILWR